MSTTASQNGGVWVLAIDGELTHANVQEFRGLADDAFAADGRDFLVDLTEATAVDSAGLEVLTWLRRECEERLGMVKLCCPSDDLGKILEMTRLDRQFDVSYIVDEALASFA